MREKFVRDRQNNVTHKRIIPGLTISFLLLSSGAQAHSPMFPDSFKYDPSDGGEGPPPRSVVTTSARISCVDGQASSYPCRRIDLLARVPRSQLGEQLQLSDIWGWTDPISGREVAIIAQQNGISFVDVSDAEDPVVLGFLRTADGSSSWRDVKVYADHAFIVADGNGNTEHGLQVFDLRTLRPILNPPITLTETAKNTDFGNAHNIAINEDSGFAYVVGSNTCSGGLLMFDISIPASPRLAGCFSLDGYTHDAQCVLYNGPDLDYKDREICIAYNEDSVTVVDVSIKSSPKLISRISYEGVGYTHQGWFVDNTHSTLVVDDELDEIQSRDKTRTYIFDLQDLDAPQLIGTHHSSTDAVDHNQYALDGFIYQANYRAGLRILNAANVSSGQLTEVAHFDTIPDSDTAQFSGAWSSYIYFPSGNIVLSDINGGLFILKANLDEPLNPPPAPPEDGGGSDNGSSFDAGDGGMLLPDRPPLDADAGVDENDSGERSQRDPSLESNSGCWTLRSTPKSAFNHHLSLFILGAYLIYRRRRRFRLDLKNVRPSHWNRSRS